MTDMQYVIYGGTSLISIHLIKKIQSNLPESKFKIFVRSKEKLDKLLKQHGILFLENNFEVYEVDILDIDKNKEYINKMDINSIDGFYFFVGVTGNPEEEFRDDILLKKNFYINLIHPILIINSISAKIKEHSHIVVITSLSGVRGRMKSLFYCSAKAGLINYLSGLRQKLNPKKILVIDFTAGYILTETFKKNFKINNFLVSEPSKVASKIISSIKNKKEIVFNNFFWRFISLIIKMIPEKIFKTLKF
tara:strand:+ start:8796 stop:9542 length:747 start_codon:yes stop_codon:yes gene_type:complete